MAEHRDDDAWRILLEILRGARAGGGLMSENEAELTFGYTCIASAVSELMERPSVRLTEELFDHLAGLHPELTSIFACSEFGTSARVLNTLAGRLANESDIDGDVLGKILLSHSLYSDAEFDPRAFLAAAPDLAWRAYLGMMSSHVVLTPKAYAMRRRLMELGPQLEDVDVPFESLDLVSRIYFLCSYDDTHGKHEIKRHLNRVFRKSLAAIGVTEPVLPTRRPSGTRPTVVVPVEQFKSNHAMYRCYAPSIRQLREDFRLVLVCPPGGVDRESRKLFDRVVALPFEPTGFRRAVVEIGKLAPDIVYYPSVGMDATVIALANLRLAPIQIASPGHPATTMAPTIDYVAVDQLYLGDPSLFSETVMVLEAGAYQCEMRPDVKPVEPVIREHADPVRVAVPSAAFKLNPTFMATLREIQDRSRRNVEFHFFPHTRGLKHHHITRRIRAWLPDARVYPGEHYNGYMANLNQCDLQAISFPFGGTNSTLDALAQGIPVFTLEQEELHSRCDAAMLRYAGAPEWLIAQSREEYVDTALRLIHGHEERVALSHGLLESDLEGLFFDWRYERHPKQVSELFTWLYDNHEMIQADGRKAWTAEARRLAARSRFDESTVGVT